MPGNPVVLTTDQQLRVIDILLRATQSNETHWSAVSPDSESYETAVRGHSYIIESVDDDGLSPYVMSIFSIAEGRRISQIVSDDPQNDDEVKVNEELTRLYDIARRRVLGTDEALANLLDDLEKIEEDLPPF